MDSELRERILAEAREAYVGVQFGPHTIIIQDGPGYWVSRPSIWVSEDSVKIPEKG